jgi:hypothetical protein
MTETRHRGDRATGAVPPLLLIVGGVLLTVVAVVAMVILGRGDETPEVTAAAVTSQVATSIPTATPQPPAPEETPTRTREVEDEEDSTSEEPTSEAPPASEPPVAATPTPMPAPAAQGPVAPSWISIAAGGVNSAIVPQGLAADGTINPGRNQVIWFTGSNRVQPGQVGTAVIAAHVTWEGAPDAFLNLPSVGVGDVVTVGYTDGAQASFTVTETAAVDKEALARSLKVWGPHPGVPRLAIITCDPAFGYQADGHTEANFVVIAEG